MKRIALVFFILAAFSCTQKPKIASDIDVTGIRAPMAIEYVAVPRMSVYATPADTAQVIGTYGYNESISILSRKGDWSEIRSFDGTGWVKSADLMNAEQAKTLSENATPRFYVQPTQIPFRARGEIILQAKVNTEGDVYQVTTVSNTTGNTMLADQNATALAQAKFFPLIDKGQRKTFTYEHHVYY